jgi:hypothetical protein
MAYIICHDCGKDFFYDVGTYLNYKGPMACPNCKFQMNVVFSDGHLLESKPFIDPDFISGLHKGIPDQPLRDYNEALTCLVNKAYRASAVMNRRCIQGALLSKNAPDDTPSKMIEWAAKQGLLTQKDKNLAISVTFFGNKGAHPQDDEINEIGELEASQGLRVTKVLLLKMYPMPLIRSF